MSEQGPSSLGQLLKNSSVVQGIQEKTGKPTTTARQEVSRQIKQVSKVGGGDPISGRGVTKSGKED